MRKVTFLLWAASLPSAIWAQNSASQTQQDATQTQDSTASQEQRAATPAKALSPQDAELKQLQEENERLSNQEKIDDLREKNAQLKAAQESKASAQTKPCTPKQAQRHAAVILGQFFERNPDRP